MKNRLKIQTGFAYLGLLFAVSITGIMLAAIGMTWSFSHQRENEQELLYAGTQIRKAIESYYLNTPGMVKRYPATFGDLLKDNRRLSVTRHLRRLYIDPMTLSTEWGVIAAPDGGIKGIYSLSSKRTIKQSAFKPEYTEFENAETYRDWKFIYEPPSQPRMPTF